MSSSAITNHTRKTPVPTPRLRRRTWLMILLMILLVHLLGLSAVAYVEEANDEQQEAVQELPPTSLLVKFRGGVNRSTRESVLSRVAIRLHQFADDNRGPRGRRGLAIFDQLALVELKPGAELGQTIAELQRDPAVEYAEPNFNVHALQTFPNDPDLDQLWGLFNTGQTGGSGGADIDAPTAWQTTTGSSDVVVAVIDTGIDYNHPDLAANIWVNPGEIPGNGVDDDGNGYVDDVHGYDFYNNDSDPMDDHFHGTHVSGTIGAVGNDGTGVVGVNWKASLMALKFLSASGSGDTAGAISAIQYAINNGAEVMSNSWGGGGYSQSLRDVILSAYNAGVVFVAAAGNNGNDSLVYPAAYDKVIAVSATDHNDRKAYFSSFGAFVDIAAPGVNIYSTTPDGSYGSASGTSMATPHVAGVAALLKALDRTLTPDQVAHILETSSTDLGDPGWDTYYGAGRLLASQAVQTVVQHQTTFPQVGITSPMNGETVTGGTLDVLGSAGGTGFASYTVEHARVDSGAWTLITSRNTPVQNGVLASWDTGSMADGDYLLLLTVTDGLNRQLHEAVIVTIDNYDATITSPAQLVSTGTVDILGSATTNNGLPFDTYVLEWGSGSAPTSFSTAGITLMNSGQQPVTDGKLATWNTSGLTAGQLYTLRLTVYSGLGGTTQTAVTVQADTDLVTGWPVILSTNSTGYVVPTVADLDGDGSKEVIVAGPDNQIRVYHKDARPFPGFPVVSDEDDHFYWAVNVADLDHDGTQEIIAVVTSLYASSRSRILILNHDGTPFAGWPNPGLKAYQGTWDLTPAVADLNNDGNLEVVTIEVFTWVTNTEVTLHAYGLDGIELTGFPRHLNLPAIGFAADQLYPANHGVASIADHDRDGYPEIAWSYSNRIFLFDHEGNVLPGWPFIVPDYNGKIMLFESALASGDIDGDGQLELFAIGRGHDCAYCETQVYGWHMDGSVLRGWPHSDQTDGIKLTGSGSTQHTPALIDLDGDGKDELIVGLANLAVFDENGRVPFPSTPIVSDTQPSAGDVDGDGLLEFSGNRKELISIGDDDGSPYWSRSMPGGGPRNTLGIFSDLDNDGNMELILTYANSSNITGLYVWQIPRTSTAPAAEEWQMFNYDTARSGRQTLSQIDPPQDSVAPTATITSPSAGDTVSSTVTVVISATDNVGVTSVELYVDGALQGTDTKVPYNIAWDATAVSGGNHTLQARAYDAARNMGTSASITVSVGSSDTTAPGVPSLVAPADGSSTDDPTPTFDWSDVSDPSGVSYQLQVDNNGDFASPEIDAGNLANSTHTPSQALNDGSWFWRVRAMDGPGNISAWSAVRSLTIDTSTTQPPSPINAPSNLAATQSGVNVRLDWKDNSDNEEGFTIERGDKVKGTLTYKVIGQVGANTTDFAEIAPTETTYYRVQAFNYNQSTSQVSDYAVAEFKVTGKGSGNGKGNGKP